MSVDSYGTWIASLNYQFNVLNFATEVLDYVPTQKRRNLVQISAYPAASQIYNAIKQSSASPQATPAGYPPNVVVGQSTGAPLSSTSSATPLQFSVSMLLDLLNAQGQDLQSNGPQVGPDGQFGIQTFSSSSVSSGGVPGGLPLHGLNASTAASEMIAAVGSDGKLGLPNVDRVLGITTPEIGYRWSKPEPQKIPS